MTRMRLDCALERAESGARVPPKHAPDHSTSRTLAALIGTVPAALLLGIALTLALPLPLDQRYLIGSYSVAPAWVALSCCVFLAASAKRAWLLVSALILVSAAASGAALAVGRGPGLELER